MFIKEFIMLGAVVISSSTLDPIIQEMGLRYGVEPALIKAHIKAESNWDVNASRYEAHKGDASWGLMQLLLATAREITGNPNMTTTDLIQPRTNIEAGTRYIALQLRRYNGSLKDAIAAYNAGTARIKPGTNEYTNQSYVDKVLNNYMMYKNIGFAVSTDDIQDFTPVLIGAAVIAGLVIMSGSEG
jgi:soluble lytic murein transglycosylase-like protein